MPQDRTVPNNRMTLTGARVVTPAGVLDPGWVSVDSGLIFEGGAVSAPDPDESALDCGWLLSAGRGAIRMVTLAPELDGALDATRQLVDAGVVVAVGHTDAIEAQVLPAVEAGATVATHLFNGMRPLHHREPGPIGVLLDDERVSVELICDLVHVHPSVIRMAARHAGLDRTVLVTDAIAAAGVGDGIYDVGGLAVT